MKNEIINHNGNPFNFERMHYGTLLWSSQLFNRRMASRFLDVNNTKALLK